MTEHEEKQFKSLMSDYVEGLRLLAEYEDLEEQGLLIRLPCKIGVPVYCIAEPCGGCEYLNETMREEFIEMCLNCERKEIITCVFDYDLIGEFGKTVFLTCEEAEAALAAREK